MFRFKSLRSWLTLWFLILALLPVVVSSIIIYFQQVEVIRTHRIETLTAIRDLKVRQVEAWLSERLGDGQIIAGSQEIANLTKILEKDLFLGGYEQEYTTRNHAIEAMRALLVRYLEGFGSYSELFVIDSEEGNVLVSSAREDEGKFKSDYPYFSETLKRREAVLSDIYFSKTLRRPSMVLSVPIFGSEQDATIIAVLVARIDLQITIYNLLNERTGMGETGETLIINKDGYALNELRWHEDAPLRLKVSATPAVLAVQGNKGVIEVEDYRGEKVLAAYTPIPQFGWGFVSKQDSAEVFSSIQGTLYNLLILVGVFSGLIIICAVYIAKRITAPLLEMKEVSGKQQKGDLSARIAINREDELGYLAESFNDLAGSIEVQMNIQIGSSTILKALVVSETLTEFSQELLKKLIEITDSSLAVFYLHNSQEQTFEILTSVGAGPDILKAFNAKDLEGELGVALASKKIERITDIPADTKFTFNAVAGQFVPCEIITIPLLERDEVKGVVSLASLRKYSDESLKILQLCWMPVSSALVNILSSEQTQHMAAELAEKNIELQANSEELQSQSEELLEQAEELRGTAAELEARRTQVEEADRLKSEFLSNMSHELRTPLNSVLALSQLMISRGTGKNPSEEKNFLEVIERNGRQLLSLINDILDLAKIESGRMDIYPTTFSLRHATDRALSTILPLAERKGLTTAVCVETADQMTSDEEKVNQILLNLLSNAVKFTDQGEVRLDVNVSEKSVDFVITDTGIGMAPADLPHIFDEFRQADGTTTRKHEGTGLGLAICQKLAGLLGGEILVESVFGQGSTFTLNLPLQIASRNENYHHNSTESSLGNDLIPGQGLCRTILSIDDEREVRELVSKHLSEAGYEVVLAASGREGLRLARELRPFAITLDVMMPEVDGWEVLKALKVDPATADIPVIMLSVSEDRATGVALGADGYLTKPVYKKILCAEMEKLGGIKAVKRVLLVDDDAVAREGIQSILQEKGYQVSQTEGGEQALAHAKEFLPDMILLDLLMPKVDGFMVLEELRSDPKLKDIPVLVLTAKDLTKSERAVLESSVNSVIAKNLSNEGPFFEEIIEALQQLDAGRVDTSRMKPKVLVVEDNETAALQIKMALEEIGIEVSSASGGVEGLESVKCSVPDAMVLDLMMPGVDGFEVLETIRSTPWTVQLPVLVLTAKELTTQDRSWLKHNNVKQLIQKGSVNKEQLVAAVRLLLESGVASSQLSVDVTALPRNQIQSKTVLVVEDNPDNLLTIQSTLAQEDCLVVSATDGLQGVEMAEKERPGLILMDMQLPVMNGMEATRKIKENPLLTGIPIIALTANAMKGDREKMLAAGCVEYLSKPFDPAELQVLVRKWLSGGA